MTRRVLRRLPAHATVDEALAYCASRGYYRPTLHACDSQLVVGFVDVTPQRIDEVVREALEEVQP